MNRVLSDTLGILNMVLALLIIVTGMAVGINRFNEVGHGASVGGILIGLFFGFVAAAAVCGTLATLLLIENHLRNIRAITEDLHARAIRARK
ncbi:MULTISPECIES: hypothetical protein [unclassified Mesorhizobium]|uniref:hypothetical protein n=1 Tax=unclassified Mesorhizobium TaxID=325217 RepID=UPI000F76321E|nr:MULTISPECIES: hypothetical protein [unclassified Mesorhizobium]AZO75341.1 hypothetical protein EJ067_32320 [Mesorhizobium sp. M1D.F.Ca.ET.043.01.1.1]RWA87685.1 MAG: hypothetical protein EOQ32_24070 [Mesorhizobium sp.]